MGAEGDRLATPEIVHHDRSAEKRDLSVASGQRVAFLVCAWRIVHAGRRLAGGGAGTVGARRAHRLGDPSAFFRGGGVRLILDLELRPIDAEARQVVDDRNGMVRVCLQSEVAIGDGALLLDQI